MTPHRFQGKILFYSSQNAEKKTLMNYLSEPKEANFDEMMMSSFHFLNFSEDEKKQLSSSHRRLLTHYKHINLFQLNKDSGEFLRLVKKCKLAHLIIEAHDYGAYICLAALYSGKLPTDKKIEFHLASSPIALFPKALMKTTLKKNHHRIIFSLTESSWLNSFSTLYSNERIKCSYLKAA